MGGALIAIILGGGGASTSDIPDPYRPRSYDETSTRFGYLDETEVRLRSYDQDSARLTKPDSAT